VRGQGPITTVTLHKVIDYVEIGILNEQMARRIAREAGASDLVEVLSEKLSGADLHSVLLTVLKRRIGKIGPNELMNPSSVTKACDLDGRLLNRLESTTYEVAAKFEVIELSPLGPLGTVAVLTGLDQSNVLSTLRSFECASDPTIGLALECARRRKNPANRKDTTRLCTNQRVVRFPLPTNPAYTAHFKLFSLVSAGRDVGSFAFETIALREHIQCYLSLLSKLNTEDFAFEHTVVEISDTRVISHLCSLFEVDRDEIRSNVRARDSASSGRLIAKYSDAWPKTVAKPSEDLAQFNLPKHLQVQLALLEKDVCAPLSLEHPEVKLVFNTQRLTGLGYYQGPCFHIKLKNAANETFMLADGGFVNWTQLLLSDAKERLMTSAIGTELICRMFRRLKQ